MGKWTNTKMCVHTVFEEYFVIPFFFYLLNCTVRLHPFTKIPVQNDLPLLFSICVRDVIQVEQKCYACIQKWYTYYYLVFELSKVVQLSNGTIFKCHLNTGLNFVLYLDHHLNIGPVFKWSSEYHTTTLDIYSEQESSLFRCLLFRYLLFRSPLYLYITKAITKL